jgi:translation initiation factor 4A
VIGTPGRLNDMMKKGFLKTEYIKVCVIDEADEMLSRGFQDSMKEIMKFLPGDITIALFSATISEEVIQISKNLLINPI